MNGEKTIEFLQSWLNSINSINNNLLSVRDIMNAHTQRADINADKIKQIYTTLDSIQKTLDVLRTNQEKNSLIIELLRSIIVERGNSAGSQQSQQTQQQLFPAPLTAQALTELEIHKLKETEQTKREEIASRSRLLSIIVPVAISALLTLITTLTVQFFSKDDTPKKEDKKIESGFDKKNHKKGGD